MDEGRELLTVAEAARRLGRPYRSVWEAASRGDLGPARRVKGRLMITADGLEAYRARKVAPQISAVPVGLFHD